jgi:CDP-diacylglycerol--serine O-phosphatidyltransferase
VQQGSMDPRYFNGLPIPAAATMIATAILFYYEIGEWAPQRHVYILAMIYLLSFLMVSNVKYVSFKKMDLVQRHPFHSLVAVVLIFVVVATAPTIMGFLLMAAYVASGPISTIMYHRQRALLEKGESEPPTPNLTKPSLDLNGRGEAGK